MSLAAHPLITVAIPLYRSEKFLKVIRRNLRRLEYPNLEILISDRHGHDKALETLKQEFADDARIRFLSADDSIGWVEHFNALMIEARGDFFMWMPHDDDFPRDYLPLLLEPLLQHPEAILAFGGIHAIDRAGRTLHSLENIGPGDAWSETWSRRLLLRMATHSNPGNAFRGLFRRAPIIERNLLIRATRRSVLADYFWVFATGFLGSWIYVPECRCKKRYYPGSAHPKWRFSEKQWLDAYRVLSGYIRDLAPGWREAAHARSAIFLWVLLNLLNTSVRSERPFKRIVPPLQRTAEWLLRPMVAEPSANNLPPVHLLWW